MTKPFYVTTPIFYPSGAPHIGTAYNVFVADTLARYARQKGKETFFLTGTDEHGQKIAEKAEDAGKTPKEFVDGIADLYKKTWKGVNSSHDIFYRTTDPHHEGFVQKLIQKAYDNGDIYEAEYEGLYCVGCESFKTEKDLVDGECQDHRGKKVKLVKEKNYYFRWSKYQDWLLEYYEANPEFVKPAKWFNFVKNFVKDGVEDIPVTRANVDWAIPAPFDKNQTIYVWYDALPNYLSALSHPDVKAKFGEKRDLEEEFWPEVTHVIGKDILKFHAILWPAMLHSVGLKPPKHILVHGFFTVNGFKIGKSNGNAIDPLELSKKYTVDAVRYALLSEFQVGNDGDFNLDRLTAKYEGELGNGWGNLLNRVIHLSNKKEIKFDESSVEESFRAEVENFVKSFEERIEAYEIFEAIKSFAELVAFGNKYISDEAPWDKACQNPTQILNNLLYLLAQTNKLAEPILPESAAKAQKALETSEKIILFPKLEG